MKKKTIILLWLVTAYSCSNYSSRLKAVLDYSGTNRAELEKVLDHYSQDPADSLKLKASIFLIENMPGHYTFGGPYMKSYNEQLGLLKNCPYYEKKIIQMVPFDHIGIPTSKANLFVLRILGVPSAIDFIPHFANRNGRHYWATAIDPRINSTQVYQVGIYKAPKIYRRTYSHNPTAKPGKREYVPYFFLDPFNKDVTDLYIPTSEIRLSAPGIRNIRHGYLAIFNDLSWQPIACSKILSTCRFIIPTKKKWSLLLLLSYYTPTELCIRLLPTKTLYSI